MGSGRGGGEEEVGKRESLGLKATRLISNYEAKIRGIPDIGGPRYIGYSVWPRCNFAVRLDLEEWHNLRVSLRSTDPASNDVSRVVSMSPATRRVAMEVNVSRVWVSQRLIVEWSIAYLKLKII